MSNELLALPGLGSALALKLNHLGIFQVKDLLFHLPRSYQDRTRCTPIRHLVMGQSGLIQGEILQAQILKGRRQSLLCHIKEGSSLLSLRFFHFYPAQIKQFIPGKWIRAYGEIRMGSFGLEMIHPEYQLYSRESLPELENCLTPIYPTTEGISQTRWRNFIRAAFAEIERNQGLTELLPESLRKSLHLPSLWEALSQVHFPSKNKAVENLLQGNHPAQQRLSLEELLAHRLAMERLRRQKEKESAPAIKVSVQKLKVQLLEILPFKLTAAQKRVFEEILNDLQKPFAMHRLLQGDVGSGKTLVALMAALSVIESGHQVALMVPTEILAEQHFLNFSKWTKTLPLRSALLKGSLSSKQKKACEAGIESGTIQLLIGTHALFQESIHFKNLGLVIVDEQHRFGVEQRKALLNKAPNGVHQLIMTATPIPRTLAMSMYGDLNVSVIDELPPGRTPVKTVLVNQGRREEILERIKHVVAQGNQVYWVCPAIEASEERENLLQAAEETYQKLSEVLSPIKVALVHGKQKPLEKQETMSQFKAGVLKVLVATTVIEVGVDVPQASLMVIENPERFGLAQLHQLRGRVGRGAQESYCVLLYQTPLSSIAEKRLRTLKETQDGFEIAEQDLNLRGPGEVFGTQQTGDLKFRIADLSRDRNLLEKVKILSETLQEEGANEAIDQLIDRWLGKKIDFREV